jgi:PAS domain S-box-containing protein
MDKKTVTNGDILARQQHLVETILENMAQAVVIVDADFNIVEFNSRFKVLFSLDQDGIHKGVPYKTFVEEWAAQVKLDEIFTREAIERMYVRNPFVLDVNYSYKEKDLWLQMFHNPLPEGGFVRTFTDITERKNSDRKLLEKTNEIEKFFSLTVDLLCIVNMEGSFKRINQAWQEFLGYDVDELIDRKIFEYIHPDDIDDTVTAMEDLASGKPVYNFINRYRHKDGSYRWLEWRANPYESILIYAAARDITERTKFEEILRQNEEKYRFLTENVGDMIWQIDKDYNYFYVSPSIENILGYSSEEIIGKSFYSILTPSSADYLAEVEEKQRYELQYHFLRSGVYELQHIRKDGSLVWCEVHSSPLYTPDGKLIFSQGVTRDIHSRKEAERKLKDYAAELKEVNATKDRFFSIISHDLKSPFNGLIGMTQEFKENARDFSYEEIAQFGNEMHEAVVNTYRLLENLLEWSRVQLDQIQFQPQSVNLAGEAEKIKQLFAVTSAQKNITIFNEADKNIFVNADINMLSGILRNLIVNAIKFSNRGGMVWINAELKDGSVIVSVKDNGVGMNDEIKRKIFRADTMYTTYGTEKERGTGLGLLLCREFIEKHNGRIWVESEPGKGSTFFFSIPADQQTFFS